MSNVYSLFTGNIADIDVETLEIAAQRNRDSIEDECLRQIGWITASVDLADCTYEQKKHLNHKIQDCLSARDEALDKNDNALFLIFMELEKSREEFFDDKTKYGLKYASRKSARLKRYLLDYLGKEELEENKKKIALAHKILSLVEQDEEYISTLRAVFQGAGRDIRIEKILPLAEVVSSPADSRELSAISLPTIAPKLWRNRDPGIKAPDFLRTVYASWIEAGVLSGVALKGLDPDLYQAYHVRVGRHPSEAVSLAERNPYARLDDAEAGKRHRESVKKSKAKAKASAESDFNANAVQFTAVSQKLEGITDEKLQIWREVSAAMSRAQRERLTPEQAEYQSKQSAKRVKAMRERMTPEQRAARNSTEAERIRRKRALAIELPTVAPRLWADRDPGTKPTDFLRTVYASWIEAGVMTRTAVKNCDDKLYNAYAVRVHRYPEEAITFADSDRKPGRAPSADVQSLIERRRVADREAKAQKRNHAKMPQLNP